MISEKKLNGDCGMVLNVNLPSYLIFSNKLMSGKCSCNNFSSKKNLII